MTLNNWFVRVILVLWLVSSAFVILLLGNIDWIVHNELYSYGLHFSLDWAVGYWATLRAIYVFLAVPIVLSIFYFGLEVWRFAKGGEIVVKGKPIKPTSRSAKDVEQNHMLISCPKCGRVFSKPLVMLDFSSGKTRLVNVCPYCNHVLNLETETVKEDVRVADLDEKKVKDCRIN